MIQTIFGLVKVLEKKAISGIEKRDELYKTLKELLGEQTFNDNKDKVDYICIANLMNQTAFGLVKVLEKKVMTGAEKRDDCIKRLKSC